MYCPGNPILTVLSWLPRAVLTWLIKIEDYRNKRYKKILF
jgi:hypothetical protein